MREFTDNFGTKYLSKSSRIERNSSSVEESVASLRRKFFDEEESNSFGKDIHLDGFRFDDPLENMPRILGDGHPEVTDDFLILGPGPNRVYKPTKFYGRYLDSIYGKRK